MNEPIKNIRKDIQPFRTRSVRTLNDRMVSLNDFVGELESKFRSAVARVEALHEAFRDDMKTMRADLDRTRDNELRASATLQRQYDMLAAEIMRMRDELKNSVE